jgi:hypothetical protein
MGYWVPGGHAGVWMPSDIERWRERQLDVFQRAQVIDALEKQRLLDEYRHAEVAGLMGRHDASLSAIGAVLADVNAHVGWMEADVSRLLAVTERSLPVIVERLTLACETLAGIAKTLASPRETEARELFASGTHALATAAGIAGKGARGLADDWFGEAVEDLTRATVVFRQAPESWHNLGLAYASLGRPRDAADAFAACARYAVADGRAGLAAESVLLAAAELRGTGDADGAGSIVREYLPLLDRCAELYVSLAVHHGETGLLAPAFKIAPMLAVAVEAKIDELEEEAAGGKASAARAELAARLAAAAQAAASEACWAEDGPVTRLRHLEAAVQAVLVAGIRAGLDLSPEGFTPAVLPPGFGVAALVLAEVRTYEVVKQARSIAAAARAGLDRLAAAASARQQAASTAQAAVLAAKEAVVKLARAERALAALETQLADAESGIRCAEAEVLNRRGVLDAREAVYDWSRPMVGWAELAALRPEIEADLRSRARTHGSYRRVGLAAGSPAHVLITFVREFGTPEEYLGRRGPAEEKLWAGWASELGLPADAPLEEAALVWANRYEDEIDEYLDEAETSLAEAQELVERARAEVGTATAQVERASAELRHGQAAADQVDHATAQYHAARDTADRAAASMSGVLADLETAIASATRPRERIVPGAGR